MVANIKGVLCLFLVAFLALVALTPLVLIALLKWVIPGARPKRLCTEVAVAIAEALVQVYKGCYQLIHRPQWDIQQVAGLSRDKSYLVISNHQAWSDVPILVFLLVGKIPFFKFFLKRELIWLPMIGIACWALDFPFMRRYSKAEMAANPELRGQDLETTRRLCQKLENDEVTLVNYLEGTRFTLAKQQKQQSPYRHLLRPKSGGIAFVLGLLGDRIDGILDVTVVYPEGVQNFWQFLCGRVEQVAARVKVRPLPALAAERYQECDTARDELQDWVAQIWQEKDELIESVLNGSTRQTTS